LLASVLLRGQRAATVVHDPRLTWNTIEVVEACGGSGAVEVGTCVHQTAHARGRWCLRRRNERAPLFSRFSYCDSGMIPWLIVAQLLSETAAPLSTLVGERMLKFPVSGELNYRVPDAKAAIAAIEARYGAAALATDRTDGVSFEFADWRFNLRSSNTEPLLRLNVEARGSDALMRAKTEELLALLETQGAVAADH
jgi:phosphomannomutase